MRKKVLAMFAERETLLKADALEYILGQPDPVSFARAVLTNMKDKRFMLSVVELKDLAGSAAAFPVKKITGRDDEPEPVKKGTFAGKPAPDETGAGHTEMEAAVSETASTPDAPEGPEPSIPLPKKNKTKDDGIEVVKDVTDKCTCEGKLKDFVLYFNDRMARLKRIVRSRRELSGSLPMNAIRSRRHEKEVKTIGMVMDVRRTRDGRVLAEIEDDTGSITILLPEEGAKHHTNLVKDEVIGVIGKPGPDGDIIFVKTTIRPDVPVGREPHRAQDPICAAFISDIHLGSKTFLEPEWKRFVDWLKGTGTDTRHQDYAKRIEYLVVSGDIVDGIGIYPDHEEDLLITDIYKQYETLSEMLKDIPPRIKIIMIPGNHDAVRPAEPQPTFAPEIRKLFDPSIIFISNPATIRLEGVEVLAYHGMSMVDFISNIPNLSFNSPIEIMKEMLRRRHLAPVFGDKTPLAPERRDWMVIDTVPDIFVTGHVHGVGVENYRGMVLINSSAWQSQTEYQKMMNFHPQPARVPVVDLQTLNWRVVSFIN